MSRIQDATESIRAVHRELFAAAPVTADAAAHQVATSLRRASVAVRLGQEDGAGQRLVSELLEECASIARLLVVRCRTDEMVTLERLVKAQGELLSVAEQVSRLEGLINERNSELCGGAPFPAPPPKPE